MAVLFFLKLAIVLWVEVIDMVYGLVNSTWWEVKGEKAGQSNQLQPPTPGPVSDPGPSQQRMEKDLE